MTMTVERAAPQISASAGLPQMTASAAELARRAEVARQAQPWLLTADERRARFDESIRRNSRSSCP